MTRDRWPDRLWEGNDTYLWPIERLYDEQPDHDPLECEERREMIRQGKQFTILIRADGLILDGHHRARASKLEGLEWISVQIASDALARGFTDIAEAKYDQQSRDAAAARWDSCMASDKGAGVMAPIFPTQRKPQYQHHFETFLFRAVDTIYGCEPKETPEDLKLLISRITKLLRKCTPVERQIVKLFVEYVAICRKDERERIAERERCDRETF